MEQKDCVIIGGGVIGLAIAKQLTTTLSSVCLLEANENIAMETSFRNSAVIHAGIYYPENSLKATLCQQGRNKLYHYCRQQNIDHQKIGKLIVASNREQLGELAALKTNAEKNGVDDLQVLTGSEATAMEPALNCVAALYSPGTGILDTSQLMAALLNEINENDGDIKLKHRFISASKNNDCFDIEIENEQGTLHIRSQLLINAAGLAATQLSKNITGILTNSIPKMYYAKGNYFQYQKPSPFQRLIYPLPEQAGLGIHATLNTKGKLYFGPDVEWIDNIDTDVSHDRKIRFCQSIRHYFPDIDTNDLIPAFAGIRPKILPPEQQPQDFVIQTAAEHGLDHYFALYGLESPGLTASLAIAEQISEML